MGSNSERFSLQDKILDIVSHIRQLCKGLLMAKGISKVVGILNTK